MSAKRAKQLRRYMELERKKENSLSVQYDRELKDKPMDHVRQVRKRMKKGIRFNESFRQAAVPYFEILRQRVSDKLDEQGALAKVKQKLAQAKRTQLLVKQLRIGPLSVKPVHKQIEEKLAAHDRHAIREQQGSVRPKEMHQKKRKGRIGRLMV